MKSVFWEVDYQTLYMNKLKYDAMKVGRICLNCILFLLPRCSKLLTGFLSLFLSFIKIVPQFFCELFPLMVNVLLNF